MINNNIIIDNGIDTSDATANASNIDSGKTAYVNGEKIIGTSTKVDTTDATATAGDIASGKTAWVNGSKVTGTNTAKAVKSITFTCYWADTTTLYGAIASSYSDYSLAKQVTISPSSRLYVYSNQANTWYSITSTLNY